MATATFQASKDSQMEGITYPNNNYGGATILSTVVMYASGTKAFLFRPIVNFDVSSIAGHTINSAKLVAVATSTSGSGWTAKVSRCTRPATWTEMGVTWNKYDGSNAWTAGGGDFDDTTPAAVIFSDPGGAGSFDITGLVNHVTDAISNRSNIVSLILRLSDEDPGVNEGLGVKSREHADTADRWYLEVDYTPVVASENLRKALGQVV